MIRADRELLAELARLNSDVVPLAMRITGETVTADEQHAFAQRLVAMARQLRARARARASEIIIEGDVAAISDYPIQNLEL